MFGYLRTKAASLVALSLVAAALVSGLLFFDHAATAQEEDPVVASVNGQDIHFSEILEVAAALPINPGTETRELFALVLTELVNLTLVEQEARRNSLQDDEEVQARTQEAETRIMRDVYLERLLAEATNDDALNSRYEDMLETYEPEVEVSARHILVASEEEAGVLIGRLNAGEDFATLAAESSLGPSSARGGDLGYFRAEQMVASFSAAAFALEVGAHSAEPVQTQFGWHVIKVEDRREAPPPAFDAVKDDLRSQIVTEALQNAFAMLREGAAIEVYEDALDQAVSPNEPSVPQAPIQPVEE